MRNSLLAPKASPRFRIGRIEALRLRGIQLIRQLAVATLASATVTSAVVGTTLHAECALITAKAVMSQREYELVFGGRVVDIQAFGPSGARVTFDVQRVWKGAVPSRIDLYYGRMSSEGPQSQFTKGEYGVAVAVRLKDAAMRRAFGVPDTRSPVDYGAVSCIDGRNKDFEAGLGASRPPRK